MEFKEASSSGKTPLSPSPKISPGKDRISEVVTEGANFPQGIAPMSLIDLPHLVILKILDFMTISEKLRTDAVSKKWREMVTTSLRYYDNLSRMTVYNEILSDVKSERQRQKLVAVLLSRMSDPSTKTNYLRNMDLTFVNPIDADPALKFPKMESLCLSLGAEPPLPTFVFSCKNLRSFSCCTRVSPQELTLLLTELSQLKELHIGIEFEENMIETLEDPVQGRVAETLYFKDANSSLESLRIDFLPGDGIANLVNACPDLKNLKFDHSDEIYNMFFNFRPLRNLNLTSLDLWGIEDLSEEDVAEINFTLSSDSPLTRSLDRFKVAQDSNQISDLELLDSLTNCRQLKVLDIHASDECHQCHDHSCVESIFTAESFPNLVELHLPCMELDSFYANNVFLDNNSFKLPLLKCLSFCACRWLTDTHISRFVGGVLRSSPLLEQVHLRECMIDDRLFTLLAKDLPETCSVKFVVRKHFIDGNPTPTYPRDYSTYCLEQTQHAEAMAARFGLNLKFLTPKDDCIHYPECKFHEFETNLVSNSFMSL